MKFRTKLLCVMKLTAVIILIATLHVSAGTGAQTVSCKLTNASLEEVLATFKKQTGFLFIYNDKDIVKAKTVSLELHNAAIETALTEAFRDQPLTYQIRGNNVVVTVKQPPALAGSSSPKEKAPPPPIDISGRVTDPDGNPLAGASVKVKGTSIGTTTGANGEFKLTSINEAAFLIISYVGYESREVAVASNPGLKTGATLSLKRSENKLDEIQVIAYGTTTQRLSTGNVSTVKAADIEKQPVNNPLLALEGRVPGLFVTQNTGMPGGGVTVRIQGQNSINAGNDPLIVIDGMPYPSQLIDPDGPLQGGSPLNFINPGDIESIDVLKDADATAIYGTRAANGAILITTKKGKAGQTRVSINLQQGWGKVTRKVHMLNTRQYLDMRYEAYRNDGIDWKAPSVLANDLKVWDTTRYTDWQKTLIGGTAQYSNVNASVSGGTNTVQYIVGATFNRVTTVFPGNSADQHGALHFTLSSSSRNQKFHFQLSGNYMVDDNRLPSTDLTQKAIITEPDAPPLYNPDGTLNWAPNAAGTSTWNNPLVYQLYQRYSNVTKNLVSNAVISYTIINGLEVRSNFGYTNLQGNNSFPSPLEGYSPENRPFAQITTGFHYRTMNSWIVEPQITYKRTIGKGRLEALAGSSIQQNNNNAVDLLGSGFTSDLLMNNISSAAFVTAGTSITQIYKYNGLFGRLNYNWDDKYLISLNARRDGSSRFGEKNRFHNFGSVGLGWIFSKEHFIENTIHILSFGKLRASYGTTGNDQISDYAYLSLYGTVNAGIPYQNTNGLDAFSIPNPNLQWEETKKLQAGIDLGFLKDRILLNATYARNRSSNELISYALPAVTGFRGVVENFPALIQNTSWEFVVSTTNIKGRDFHWSSSLNLTIPHNKVVSFPNIATSSYANGFNGVIVGEPLGVIKKWHGLGVDPATGGYLVADKKGNPEKFPKFPDDLTALINPAFPRYYGGLQNSLSYKSFQLDFLFQFTRQLAPKDLYYFNGLAIPGQFYSQESNQPATVLKRWQKPGDITSIGRYNINYAAIPQLESLSDLGYSYAASYIRLKNVSIAWQFPPKWLKITHMQDGRIYFQGQNLATITRYTGLDPETKNSNTLPPLRVWTVGIKLEL